MSFDPRYLAAKKSIDDRALNHHVWETLHHVLSQSADGESLDILEIGAGTGTMLERIVERGLLIRPVTYVLTDNDPGLLRAARRHLSAWAEKQGHTLAWSGKYRGLLCTATAEASLVLDPVSAEELATRSDSFGLFNLMIAHAVLDLIDFPVVLPQLLPRIKDNGLAYCTCNFDGETLFLPEHHCDEEILRCYHTSMEARLPGASRTGRRLLTFLQDPGFDLLDAGSSDWIIHPRGGGYSKDEAFFLHAIVATVEGELAGSSCPPFGLAAWAELRHRQIDGGTLCFLARHLDLLARYRPPLL